MSVGRASNYALRKGKLALRGDWAISMKLVERKIGRHHIAFFRAAILGMDIGEMSDRYLETGMDLRRAKTTLTWIRDTLRQAALRSGKHREAHLIRMHVGAGGGESALSPAPPLMITALSLILMDSLQKKNLFALTWMPTRKQSIPNKRKGND